MKVLTGRIGQILLLLVSCFSVQSAFGTQIESGSIYICCMSLGSGTFSLAGDGFAVTGFTDSAGVWGPAGGCINACTALDVRGIVSGTDIRNGSATIDGTTFPNVRWGYGSLITVTGPPILLDHGPGTYVGPFSFAGYLCGSDPAFNAALGPPPCIVSLPELTGSGLVTVVIEALPHAPMQEVDATYTFIAPEPSSMVLVASAGLIFFLGRKKLHRALYLVAAPGAEWEEHRAHSRRKTRRRSSPWKRGGTV